MRTKRLDPRKLKTTLHPLTDAGVLHARVIVLSDKLTTASRERQALREKLANADVAVADATTTYREAVRQLYVSRGKLSGSDLAMALRLELHWRANMLDGPLEEVQAELDKMEAEAKEVPLEPAT